MKHQEHIVCIKANKVAHHSNGTVEYNLELKDLMLGQRSILEYDTDFRQVLPISVFLFNGSIWAYERTKHGGEDRLHSKVAVAVGGHWDMADMIIKHGVIDLPASLENAIKRELEEEVNITAKIIKTYKLPRMVCANDTEVDKVHLGMVWVHELDGPGLNSAEDQLRTIGFVQPAELLNGEYNTETWARIICEMIEPSTP